MAIRERPEILKAITQGEFGPNGHGRLNELHQDVTRQVLEGRKRDVEAFRLQTQAAAKEMSQHEQSELKLMKEMGLDTAKLDAIQRERQAAGEKRFKAIQAEMDKQSQEPSDMALDMAIAPSFLPEGAQALAPCWVAATSTQEDTNKMTRSAALAPHALLTGGATKDYWNWASGGGWGCLGTGVGENQAWIDFGFWFTPSASKFYAVNPLFRFRGYYIVQADDGWFDCKSAQVRVSAWTNVYQYNWKGWNHADVLDVHGDNINVNYRFDTDRYTYNSYLLGGGDPAWIQCTIGLYVRAQGGGSYAKNDFATGAANYLSVPLCYVY